jgi:hypothetical protein
VSLLWWRQPPVLLDVIVNLKHDPDTALRGVLWRARGPWLVLRQAKVIGPQGATDMDGDVFVPRANVAFLQAPPAGR